MPVSPNYYAVASPTFQRAMRNILSITNSNPAIVVTTYDGINPSPHGFLPGLIVRLYIPNNFGMVQANEMQGTITVIDLNTFSISIDTSLFDPFMVPSFSPGFNGTPAQVVPIGEENDTLLNATQNVLPPFVPYVIPPFLP